MLRSNKGAPIFTVICIKDSLDITNNSNRKSNDTKRSSPIKKRGINSKIILDIRQGDVIKVVGSCKPDGSCIRKIPTITQRLETGFLDSRVPLHKPNNESVWWIGTIIKRRKNDTRELTGRFPQKCVALMTELRAKNSTFRCKMCNRMMQNYSTNSILNKYGITGENSNLFGKDELCIECEPQILKSVQSIVETILKPNSEEEVLQMLKFLSRKNLIHEKVAAETNEIIAQSKSPRASNASLKEIKSIPLDLLPTSPTA